MVFWAVSVRSYEAAKIVLGEYPYMLEAAV